MKKIKIALIGAGFVSQVAHLPAFISNKKVKIISICDTNLKLLKKVSNQFKVKNYYTSYKNMIKSEIIDGVVLSVQRKKTAKIANYILKNKIPLLSEKPAALNYKSAKKLSDLAKKNSTKYLIGYMKRHDNGIKFIKKYLLKKNTLGNLYSVYYESFQGRSFSNKFNFFSQTKSYIRKMSLNSKLNNKNFSYLRFLNSQCHSINLLRYLFGDIKYLSKSLHPSGEGQIIFKKENITFILNNQYSKSKEWIENINLNFQNGKIVIKLPSPLFKNQTSKIVISYYKNNKLFKPKIKLGWSFKNQANEFINFLENKKSNFDLSTGSKSLKDIKIIEKIFKN